MAIRLSNLEMAGWKNETESRRRKTGKMETGDRRQENGE